MRTLVIGSLLSGMLPVAVMSSTAAAGVDRARAGPAHDDGGAGHACLVRAPVPVAWITLSGMTDGMSCGGEVIAFARLEQASGRARLLAHVRRDAGRARSAAFELVAMTHAMPGVPIGLTWDGGLAVTANNYRQAERRLATQLGERQGDARADRSRGP